MRIKTLISNKKIAKQYKNLESIRGKKKYTFYIEDEGPMRVNLTFFKKLCKTKGTWTELFQCCNA